MTHERLERRLRAEATRDEAAWAARPLPPTVADARASLGPSRPMGGVLLAVATVATVVVAIGAWALASSLLTASPRGVGHSPAAIPSPPASAVAASPSTSAATASPPASAQPGIFSCGADDFAVASDPWGGAAGSRGTTVVMRVVSSTAACDLPAVVTARIADARGATVVEGASDPVAGERVGPGTQLEIGIAWSNWCEDEPVGPLGLELRLDDVGPWMPIAAPESAGPLVPPCMGSGQATNLSVMGFQPSERAPIEG